MLPGDHLSILVLAAQRLLLRFAHLNLNHVASSPPEVLHHRVALQNLGVLPWEPPPQSLHFLLVEAPVSQKRCGVTRLAYA